MFDLVYLQSENLVKFHQTHTVDLILLWYFDCGYECFRCEKGNDVYIIQQDIGISECVS